MLADLAVRDVLEGVELLILGGDLDAAAEGGAFFNYLLPQGLALTSSVRYGSGADNKGLLVDLGAAYSTALTAQWRLSAGAGFTLANAGHMQSFFGVTGEQSAAVPFASREDVDAALRRALTEPPWYHHG